MELQLGSDQKLFQETTARFLDDTVPLTTVRGLVDNSDGFEWDWWHQAAELGWTSLVAPEEHGGGSISGEGVRDLALAAYERGRLVSPGPFVPTNVVLAALTEAPDRSADHDPLVASLISGDAVASFALDEIGRPFGVAGIATTATASGDGVVVTGVKAPVEAGMQAAAHLVAAHGDDGPLLVLVPADAAGVTATARGSIDLTRRYATVSFDGVQVPASAVIARGGAAIERCIDIANVLQLAETVGALDRVFDFTMEWAFDRYTFGRPLASYQELKHRFADMKLWIEGSKATTIAAAKAVSNNVAESSELASAAKAYVSQYATEIIQDCVQMHGGIGVTWEHDIHLYLRRVTLNSGTYGTTTDHRRRVAAIIMEGA